MSTDEETQQEASLELYEAQLSQVEQAIGAAGESPDLVQLKNDLEELIALTKESLLNLKKARLLQSLDDPVAESSTPASVEQPGSSNDSEDEYAAFQAAIAGDMTQPSTSSTSQSSTTWQSKRNGSDNNQGINNDQDDDEDEDPDDNLDINISELIGTKCRAPFSSEWRGHHYGNAMIWSVESSTDEQKSDPQKVRVIFLNPIHPSIIPCQYFLDGNCRFSDEQCRRSHGHPVVVSELKAYQDPDHSKICEGCRCLAKSTDDVWHPATVTDVCDDHLVNVRFDGQKEECTVNVEHIVPLDDESDDEGSEDSGDEAGPSGLHADRGGDDEDSDSDSGLPVYLWKPAQTTEKLGAWEVHTKGIGSKLMAKMGYITGQGLGPQGDGRAEPVPIMLLPQGKSLDKIMELKQLSGNDDLFNAMKKLEKRQKIMLKKAEEQEKKKEIRDNSGVFGFINKKLTEEKGQGHGHRHTHHHHPAGHSKHAQPAVESGERELTKRSDKEVNLQIFQTAEEIRAVERNIALLRKQLARNESRDRKMAEQVREKISAQEKYLRELQTSSRTLESHKQRRSDHKKLTIF